MLGCSPGFPATGARQPHGHHVHQVLVCVVLQTTIASRLAHRAIQRVVGEQQLQDELADLDDLLAVGLDLHAFVDRGAACGHRPPGALYLHQAHAAGPVGLQTRVVAERGDVHAGGASHLQNGLAGTPGPPGLLETSPLDGQSHHLQSPRFRRRTSGPPHSVEATLLVAGAALDAQFFVDHVDFLPLSGDGRPSGIPAGKPGSPCRSQDLSRT